MKFKKSSDAEKWRRVLISDMMSSEESDMDEEKEVLKVHSLPWRAVSVSRMFTHWTKKLPNKRTPQSRRQMKERVMGEESDRPGPEITCSWALMK